MALVQAWPQIATGAEKVIELLLAAGASAVALLGLDTFLSEVDMPPIVPPKTQFKNIGYMERLECADTPAKNEENSGGERTVNPNGLTQEEQDAINDVLSGSTKGDKTKGPTEQRSKDGGYGQAESDFDSIPLTDEHPITTPWGEGRSGSLSNGRHVTVRPGSSKGPPTLQIPEGSTRQIEIRYY